MTTRSIVVGTDFSRRSVEGLEIAARLCDRLGAARLHVVHVTGFPVRRHVLGAPYVIPRTVEDSLAKSLLSVAEERLAALRVPTTTAEVVRHAVFGIPARELTATAKKLEADLLIVSSRGHGSLARIALGSLAQTVVRTAHCPVLVVRQAEGEEPRFEKVLAAVDLSEISPDVVRNALAISGSAQGAACLLTVVGKGEEAEGLAAHTQSALESLISEHNSGGSARVHLLRGANAAKKILAFAKNERPDLIVIGSGGHGAWHRMILGSTATRVLAEARCSVLVVPHHGDASGPEAAG